MWKRSAIAVLLAAVAGLCAEPKDRIKALQEKLIAPCCWSESVAVHRSETAAEMRAEIAKMVSEGRSDEEIVNYYVSQHGKRILMEPEGRLRVWAYTIPIVAGVAGLWLVLWLIRRMLRDAPPPEARERA